MGPTIVRIAGFVLLLASGFLYLVSGLVVPGPYLYLLWAVWLGLLMFAVVRREDWRVVAALPFVSVGLWFAILWAGETYLGWTA